MRGRRNVWQWCKEEGVAMISGGGVCNDEEEDVIW